MNIRFFIVFCLLLSLSVDSRSQNLKKNDSLEIVLANAFGQSRIRQLFDLSYSYVGKNNADALRYALEGYQLSMLYADSLYVVRFGLVMASVLRRTDQHDSAAIVYSAVLPIAEGNAYWEELMIGLNSAGIMLLNTGDYDEALVYFFKSLELRKRAGDTVAQVTVLNNIGTVYYKLKNYEKALKMFLHCLKLQQALGLKEGMDLASINAGHAYAYIGRYDSALFYVNLGLKLCGTECARARFMEADFVRGIVYFGQRDLIKSEQSFKRSYEMAQRVNNVRFQLDNIDCLSQIYMTRGDYRSAYLYLQLGEALLKKYPSFKLEASKLFSRFSELHSRRKQFQTAYDYQRKYAKMTDEVYSADLTQNLIRIEADYLERENVAKISAQQGLLLLKEQEIANQLMVNKLVVLLGLFSIALAVVLYRNYKQKLRINALLRTKIDERTRQFQVDAESLIKLSHERDNILTRQSQMFGDFLYRVKGLCLVGLKETLDPVGRYYISKIDSLMKECTARLAQPDTLV